MEKIYQNQQALYKPILGNLDQTDTGMSKIVRGLQSGQLPQGKNLLELEQSKNRTSWKEVLGNFAPAIISVTDPKTSLIPEQLTIAGGWCAIRTSEVKKIEDGWLVNPETNTPEPITSVNQVADWIEKAVSFDQVVESIAPINGKQMMAISEVKLWSERISDKVGGVLRKPLSSGEKERIFNAVESADQTRFQLTKRYLNFATQSDRGDALIRLPDYQIWQELLAARDELLAKAEVSLEALARQNGNSRPFLNSLSMVWAMYSEPYFRNLKQSGYISEKTYLLAEPATHAISASPTEADFIYQVYRRLGIYFDRQGLNPNTGYAAFIGCVDSSGKNARPNLELGSIPNLSSWQQWLSEGRLAPINNLTVNLKDNQLLLWGLNLMPFDSGVQQAILNLNNIRVEFSQSKKEISSRFPGKSAQQPIEQLKREFEPQIFSQNQVLADRLNSFFQYLTT